ncbi:MAG: HAMP domain-containing histidine kinase, partial [Elusimicrobia bacterium]|nr:HAMP domain-containing histidine kinase [Elusimicrobiota bacterium]
MSPLGALLIGFAGGGLAGWGIATWMSGEARRRQGRFLSFVSHELNTPLTAMNMTVLNFVRGVFGSLSPEHEQWMKILMEQTARLADLVGDLRDLVHIEFHRDFRMHFAETNMKDVLLRSAETVESGLARMKIPFAMETPEGLPLVWADPDRIRRVIDDLIAHAKKFRQGGGLSVAAAHSAGGGVEVAVRFKGPYVDQQEIERMVDLFYIVDRKKTTVLSSVGLGLGMCRMIVEGCGGTFSMTVGQSGETTFTVTL